MKAELEKVREWADAKLSTGAEPPWAWYQYMKLRETLDAILQGMATTTTESSLQSAEHPGAHLLLVGSTDPQDSAQPHHVGLPTQMPM